MPASLPKRISTFLSCSWSTCAKYFFIAAAVRMELVLPREMSAAFIKSDYILFFLWVHQKVSFPKNVLAYKHRIGHMAAVSKSKLLFQRRVLEQKLHSNNRALFDTRG